MSLRKTHKRKKYSRMHGRNMGTAGHGARKKNKGSGHRGGIGMAGSGKRGDQKKTLVQKLYGHGYFGKQGITSKSTQRDKRQRIDLRDIISNKDKYKNKKGEFELKEYKILGEGDVSEKMIIHAKEASASAIEKVKKAGGEIILKKKEEFEAKKLIITQKNKEAVKGKKEKVVSK